ncbi:hypothetical protein C1645_779892 [Glomus cerebriforme]|uniref:G-protein coupled receptors family 1 profile domain-containing protein n=1 Tax=Glomus cerebriforme TaxID=658196 RepID=A0A397SN36_9GLOM|nr:hypothetical protein C1645_779892 [Glomus cerebriforme]
MSTSNICEFTYGIHNCEGSKEYKILYIICIVMWFIPCIFSFSLLYWKFKYRKNSKLFIDKLFAPLEGFLLWNGISNLAHIIHYVVILGNFFSGYPVIRELIFAFSWSFGFVGIYSFIAGMFQSILCMKFEQFTTSATHRTLENANNDSRNRSTTVWIPKGYQVTISFWALTFLLFALTTTFSIIMGLNRNIVRENDAFMRHNKPFLFANGFLFGTLWFNCVLIFTILRYYGRNLVRIIKESFTLTGIQDTRDSDVPDRIKRKLENAKNTFEAYINELRTFNYGICALMLWFSISLIPLAVIYERIFKTLWIGLLLTAISNFLTSTCLTIVLIKILKAELNPYREEATAEALIELNEMNSYFSEVDSSEV